MPLPDTDAQSHVFDYDAVFEPDDYLYFYEDTFRAENAPAQVDAIERETGMVPPMRVLDFGCGHGRHANEFARRGYAVLGVDRSERFLEIARDEAARQGLDATYVHGDLRDVAYDAEFDRAVCLFDVFGTLRDEENERVLANAARALRPGGSLCLDVRNRDWMVRNLLPTAVLERDGDLMVDRHAFDAYTGRLVDRRVVVRGGATRHAPFSVRLYTFNELRAMLRAAGLEVREAWGDWRGSPLSVNLNRMVLFAEKRW